jgi:hypothetical protein
MFHFGRRLLVTRNSRIEEYDTIYNSGAIEGTKRIINNWLSGLNKKHLPFVITNSQKQRFTIYCKEETWGMEKI